MLLCVIRFPVSFMILTKMLSPLGQLGPSASITTYRLLLSSVCHVGTALLLAIAACRAQPPNAAAPVAAATRLTPCESRYLSAERS